MEQYRSGFVSVVGRPNTGKSTLLNAIIGQKVAIVSNKPQTTRNLIKGFYSGEGFQIIFTDTPGMHQPRTALGDYMMSTVRTALEGIDCLVYMIDASIGIKDQERETLSELYESGTPMILVMNKADITEKVNLFFLREELEKTYPNVKGIVTISAKENQGVEELVNLISTLLPVGPKYYDEDYYTDQTESFMVAEIIREKALGLLRDEIPHGIGVDVERMKWKKGRVSINASIICEKKSHKGIIIGKNGAMLKELGSQARADIEALLDKQVYLELWVKIRDDWRNDNTMMRMLGYKNE